MLFLKRLNRCFHALLGVDRKSFSKFSATREFEEVKFNVPWGHVSGKWYGPRNSRPIVGFHGILDNAGTFDTIAPLLPQHIGFLAIDLPGHGLSSWLPDGCIYHSTDYVSLILILMRELKWNKISMIGHSLSSINGFIFCTLFPDKCDMFVGLDVLKPIVPPKAMILSTLTDSMAAILKVDKWKQNQIEPPCYNYEQLVDRLHEGTGRSVDKDCCRFILNRNIKSSKRDSKKYYFSRDVRLKSFVLDMLPHDVTIEMARRITCPHLFIKALQSPYYENKANYDEMIDLLIHKPTFQYHKVDGKHHVHLNEPNKIANIINPFINKYRPK